MVLIGLLSQNEGAWLASESMRIWVVNFNGWMFGTDRLSGETDWLVSNNHADLAQKPLDPWPSMD